MSFLGLFGGDEANSSSSSNTYDTTTTTNTDRRLVTDGGSIGISSDSSQIDINTNTYTVDAGSVDAAVALGVTAINDGALLGYMTTSAALGTAANVIDNAINGAFGGLAQVSADNATNTANLITGAMALGANARDMAASGNALAAQVSADGLGTLRDLTRSASDQYADLLNTTQGMFSRIATTEQANMDLTRELARGASSAYADATAQATGSKTLMLVGLAVVGVVAVSLLKK